MINPSFQDKKGRFIKNHKMNHTKEWNDNISKALTGKEVSLETREKMRINRTGKKASPQTIEKMKIKNKEMWENMSEETKAKRSERISKKLKGNKSMILESTGHHRNYKDITGQRYGNLMVVSLFGYGSNGGKYDSGAKMWNVLCDCGKTEIIMERELCNGNTLSCGCLPSRSAKNILGEKFGRLTVISYAGETRRNSCMWDVICDCGIKKVVRSGDLISGNTKSCGCLAKETKLKNGLKRIGKFTYDKSPSWKGYKMIPRTMFNSTIHGASTRDLEFSLTIEFLADLYEKQKGLCALSGLPIDFIPRSITGSKRKRCCTASLDRIDSNLGYIPTNVQWTHTDVNMLKRQYDQKHFIELCKLIANNK